MGGSRGTRETRFTRFTRFRVSFISWTPCLRTVSVTFRPGRPKSRKDSHLRDRRKRSSKGTVLDRFWHGTCQNRGKPGATRCQRDISPLEIVTTFRRIIHEFMNSS